MQQLDIERIRTALANRKTTSQRRAEQGDGGVDLEPLIRSQPLLADIKLTGFEDDLTKRLLIANHLLGKTGRLTLRPVLPALLQLKGRPYQLRDHFPFEPFFRTRMPKATLLKTGRQVSKSTSLAAQGILFSNCIPYFSTLYVTPLFEMVRRFSQNYVRPFIETSPVMKLFSGSKTINSVLQRSFMNHSHMHFSFAFLDAERTRGISADKNVIDETVRVGTMVSGPRGSWPIETLVPGDPIYAFDENGNLQIDEVVKCSDHGVRDCYRFEFSDGSAVESTSDSFLATTAGWRCISTVLRELVAAADSGAARNNAGRCPYASYENHEGKPAIPQSARLQAAHLQSGEVPGLTRVRKQLSQEEEESRLRRMVERLADQELPRIAPYRFLVSPRWPEARDPDLARPDDVGGRGLVVPGRREPATADGGVQYPGLYPAGSRTPGFLADAEGYRRQCEQDPQPSQLGETSLDREAHDRIDLPADSVDPALRRPRDAVQVSTAEGQGSVGLPLVPAGVYPCSTRSESLHGYGSQAVLPGLGVPQGQAPRTQQSTVIQAGQEGRQKRQAAAEVRGQFGSQPCESREVCGRLPVAKSREGVGVSPGLARLPEAELVRVTWTGKHRVFDLQTKLYRTFFAGNVAVHNCQDMDINFLPIIHETMSGSPDWGLKQYAGTPKTLDNTIEQLWLDSSMAEWFIKCRQPGCGKWNIPSLEFDLIDMIGPYHPDISEDRPGVVCAKCGKPVNPRYGHWVHRIRGRHWMFAGYHVPQIIMPMHYNNPEKWEILLGKKAGRGNTPLHVFFNEVCGESYDAGAKMITITDLRRAATLPWENKVDEAVKHIREYIYRVIAVDWGGGGVDAKGKPDEKYRSYTSAAVLGMLPNGKIHAIYGIRSLHPHAHIREAKLLLGMMGKFRCSHVIHDYTGAGSVRETVMKQAGMPLDRIIPVAMTPAHKGTIFQMVQATKLQPRWHFQCDSPRSLNYTCQLIRSGGIRFFQYDYQGSSAPGLLHDFLHMIEDKSDVGGRPVYKILHDPTGPDDFAQAVNIGVMALCQISGKWPDIADLEDVEISADAIRAAFPVSVKDWDDI